jgi:hypothetical protein
MKKAMRSAGLPVSLISHVTVDIIESPQGVGYVIASTESCCCLLPQGVSSNRFMVGLIVQDNRYSEDM